MTDTDIIEPKRQPKIIGYMSALYARMTEEAQTVTDESGSIQVWQGRLIATCTSVGIPEGYYKKVVDVLRELGCIELITRGRRGGTLTAYALRQPPTPEAYEQAIVKSGWEGLTSKPSLDRLASQVEDMSKQLGGFNIPDALGNFEVRIQNLETAIKDLWQQVVQLNNNKSNSK